MILINKKTAGNFPKAYQDWLSENQNAIASLHTDLRSARTLWELLGKTLTERETDIDPLNVRYQLQYSLYEEQGGICCYCGDRLRRDWNVNTQKWEFFKQSIEHFKGKSQHKRLMFNYENLMLCCKNSTGFSKIKIGGIFGGIEVRNWDDATRISEIPLEKIIDYPSNRDLKKKNRLENGDVIRIPNPTHCDDQKSKFDSDPDLAIINPTCDGHLIEKLTYNAEGQISFNNANADEETIILLTIKVLALGIEKLTEKRKVAWGKSDKDAFEEKYADSLLAINSANVSIEKRKEVVRKLIGKILEPDDSDGLLSPFCFVEYASLKHQFASIFS